MDKQSKAILAEIRRHAGLGGDGKPLDYSKEFPQVIRTKELNFREIQESKIITNSK